MTDAFEKIKEGLLRGASSVAESGSRALERGRLHTVLFRLEDAEKEKLLTLGEICYRKHSHQVEDASAMSYICEELDHLRQEIADLRQQLAKQD